MEPAEKRQLLEIKMYLKIGGEENAQMLFKLNILSLLMYNALIVLKINWQLIFKQILTKLKRHIKFINS